MALEISRRRFLLVASVLPACGSSSTSTPGERANPSPPASTPDGGEPTPSCDEATVDDPIGPFYKEGAPTRSDLTEVGMGGQRLVVRGRVLGVGGACAGLGGAVLDVWQADDAGGYDNDGYRLRGKVVAGSDGAYELTTILPGRYLNGPQYRPRHVHVIVGAPGHVALTTQLYFDGDPYNALDSMFKPELVMHPATDASSGLLVARFDFVLRAG